MESKKIIVDVNHNTSVELVGRKLIAYLQRNKHNGVIDFHLRIDSDSHFYIHPQYTGGETLDINWEAEDTSCSMESVGMDYFGVCSANVCAHKTSGICDLGKCILENKQL